MTDSRSRCRASGLGLIDGFLVCAISAVLIAMTAASFQPLIRQSRVRLATDEFHQAILTARSQAISRAQRIDVIPIEQQDWRYGWVVLVDLNNNQKLDPGEPLIYRSQAEVSGLQVESRLRESKRAYLAFDAHGRPRSANSSHVPQIGSLIFSVGDARRKLIISFLGRVRLCDPDRDASTC